MVRGPELGIVLLENNSETTCDILVTWHRDQYRLNYKQHTRVSSTTRLTSQAHKASTSRRLTTMKASHLFITVAC